MLSIECYPVLDGVMVHVRGVDLSRIATGVRPEPANAWRTIPTETVEAVGMDEALRDVLMDVVVLYPGLLHYALV